MTSSPADPVAAQEPHSAWLLIPVGMLLIILAGIAFSAAFAIAAVIDGLTAIGSVIVLTIYSLVRFPRAAIKQSHRRSR